MDADVLVDACFLQGLLEHGLGAACGIASAILPFEKEFLGFVLPEVGADLLQDACRQVHKAVLLALGPADMHLHVAAVDARYLQCHQLTDAQAHTVAEAEHGVVLQVGGMVQQAFHVLRADVLGQGMSLLGPGDLGEEFFTMQHCPK